MKPRNELYIGGGVVEMSIETDHYGGWTLFAQEALFAEIPVGMNLHAGEDFNPPRIVFF